jgi:hypothetical protein
MSICFELHWDQIGRSRRSLLHTAGWLFIVCSRALFLGHFCYDQRIGKLWSVPVADKPAFFLGFERFRMRTMDALSVRTNIDSMLLFFVSCELYVGDMRTVERWRLTKS